MATDSGVQHTIGHRTLIQTFLERAHNDSNAVFGSFSITQDPQTQLHDFTFGTLSRAVDFCAWRIVEQYGQSQDHETLLYMGPSDFRYTIVLFAAIKCGYKACFQNPANSVDDNISILDQTNCVKALHSCEMQDLLKEYQSCRPQLRTVEIPSLVHFFHRQSEVNSFPFATRPWEQSKHDPIVVLHSSGTTGSPKPVVLRNGYIKPFDAKWEHGGRWVSLFDQPDESFMYGPFPAFHLGGLLLMTVIPTLARHCAAVVPAPDLNTSKNADLAIEIMSMKDVRVLTASPLLLEKIAKCETGLQALVKLKVVAYGGGPLRPALGDELSKRGVRLRSIYGSTEAGWVPTLAPRLTDWQWLQFHPDLQVDWQDQGEGVFELCFGDGGRATNELRGIHWTLQQHTWHSKDLFIRHPHQEHLWKFIGRQDDMLLLSHGDKVNPIPVEDVVNIHPNVAAALMAGENKWPPCMLIEPHERPTDVAAFQQKVWPSIEKANALIRQDSRIPVSHVLIVDPGSFVRSPKGSIVRKRTTEKYADTIGRLYEDVVIVKSVSDDR